MAWLERLLVGVDFSPASMAALRYGSFLAEFYGAALGVVHVPSRLAEREESWVVRDDMFRLIDRSTRLQKLIEQSPEPAARNATVIMEIGNPVEALLASTRKLEPGLLLVGRSSDPGAGMLAKLHKRGLEAVMAVRPDARVPAADRTISAGFTSC